MSREYVFDGSPETKDHLVCGAAAPLAAFPERLDEWRRGRPDARKIRAPRLASRTAVDALLSEDRELADAVPAPERQRAARALRVPVRPLDPGPFEMAWLDLPESAFALLICDGAIECDVVLGDRVTTELLVEGDVLLPARPSPTTPSSEARHTAVTQSRLAVLDRGFLLAAAQWPGLMRIVMGRVTDRQHRLAVYGAICQLPRVEQRIMAFLHHLAGRVGTVTPDGIILRQRLSHRQLAARVGARRPTVSLALAALQDDGHLRHLDDGGWLLPHHDGEPVGVETLVPIRRSLT